MKRIVIVGASAAGMQAAQAARMYDDTLNITVVADESYLPYVRYRLPAVLAGTLREEELIYRSPEFFSEKRIEWLRPARVTSINPDKGHVVLDNKNRLVYDALIIASGVRSVLPKDIKGIQRHGVCRVHTLAGIKDMIELIPISEMACVWGAGVAGVQVAAALQKRGLEVKIIQPPDSILPGVADQRMAQLCAAALGQLGVEIITGTTITEIFGNGDVKAVRLNSGKVVACGIVAVDAFRQAAVSFLKETDFAVAAAGIVVDEYLRAGADNIFAAGDVVQVRNAVTGAVHTGGAWSAAEEQGALAGRNAVLFLQGREQEAQSYAGMIPSACWKCGNKQFVSVGITDAVDAADDIFENVHEDGSYRKIVVRGNRLCGMVAAGDTVPAPETITRMIAGGEAVAGLPDSLLRDFGAAAVNAVPGTEEKV